MAKDGEENLAKPNPPPIFAIHTRSAITRVNDDDDDDDDDDEERDKDRAGWGVEEMSWINWYFVVLPWRLPKNTVRPSSLSKLR